MVHAKEEADEEDTATTLRNLRLVGEEEQAIQIIVYMTK
jgi:hypothetical protein